MSGPATKMKVLLVEDDAATVRAYHRCLEGAGYSVSASLTRDAALAALHREAFDLCLLDIGLGDESGLDLLPEFRQSAPWMRTIMVTANDDVSVALQSVEAGAADYLVKPCAPEQLLHVVRRHAQLRTLEKRLETEQDGREAPWMQYFETHDRALADMLRKARQVAETDAAILILGESGTGKSILAKTLHEWSHRRGAVLATVSCPALSPELLESELFGHVRGAFTGATDNRQGRVQVADGGTLFLDEIGDLPLGLQSKLLRFVQDREYERVGDPHTRTADVRIIAATNRPLETMVADKAFREDLYYRLNVISLTLPALRDRRDDIVPLAQSLLLQFARQYARPARAFDRETEAALRGHSWPGNLRQLRNAIEHAAILCPAARVGLEHLPMTLSQQPVRRDGMRIGDHLPLAEIERAHIQAVLESTPTLEAAAEVLGIDSSTLYRKRRAMAAR